ncbi:MAG: hypothetical protein IH951_14720 [Bacteroidetes bacterium]|nr:hypothetical protein [Bacteroidota bacterium]
MTQAVDNGVLEEQHEALREKYDPFKIVIEFVDATVHYDNFATRMILLINLLRNIDPRDEDHSTILDIMRSEAEWHNDASRSYKAKAEATYDKLHELLEQASW